ncbi:kinase-like domain-containing protein [Hypoxylon sp. FL1150]|nr:kinase-like domain-containing protein [Hypoxylon sp. FL1150]
MAANIIETELERLSIHDKNEEKHIIKATSTLPKKTNQANLLKIALHNHADITSFSPPRHPVLPCPSVRKVLPSTAPAATKPDQEVSENSQSLPLVRQPAIRAMHLGMFEIGKPLGKGKFGRVYLAREASTRKLQQNRYEKQVQRKIEIQSNLRHPNILKLFGHFHDNKHIILILKFAGKGELYKHLHKANRFPEWQAAQYIAQMCSALRYLHRKHVIHRDIKPENILVGIHGEIKISDFGWSVHAPSNRRKTYCGILDYLPPEMIIPKTSDGSYDEKVDLWSLGVLTYEFLVGEAPFEDAPVMTTRRIARGDMKVPSFVSAEAADLIKGLLVVDPEKRLTLEEVQKHPWIIKYCRRDALVKKSGNA